MPALEFEKPDQEMHNAALVRWMRQHTEEWCDGCRRKETWLRAIREIKQAPKLNAHDDLKPKDTRAGQGIHIHGVGPAVCSFLEQVPEDVWSEAGKNVRGGVAKKTIGSLKLKVISKTSERYPMIQFGPLWCSGHGQLPERQAGQPHQVPAQGQHGPAHSLPANCTAPSVCERPLGPPPAETSRSHTSGW